jgi:hypothetical protein
MVYLLSAVVLAICGAFLVIHYEYKKKLWDAHLILAIWSLLLAGMNLMKFLG